MSVMSLPQAQAYISRLPHFLVPKKTGGMMDVGWLPENRRIGKYLRQQHSLRMAMHRTADGGSWPKTMLPPFRPIPEPQFGKAGVIDIRSGEPRFAVIWGGEMMDRAVQNTEEINAKVQKTYGPALYRPRSKRVTGWIVQYMMRRGVQVANKKRTASRLHAMLTTDRVAGATLKPTKAGLEYGLRTPASRWAAPQQLGGTFRGGLGGNQRITPREFIGMNQSDVAWILKVYQDGVARREEQLAKGYRGL